MYKNDLEAALRRAEASEEELRRLKEDSKEKLRKLKEKKMEQVEMSRRLREKRIKKLDITAMLSFLGILLVGTVVAGYQNCKAHNEQKLLEARDHKRAVEECKKEMRNKETVLDAKVLSRTEAQWSKEGTFLEIACTIRGAGRIVYNKHLALTLEEFYGKGMR